MTKADANAPVLLKMARTYRELAERRALEGREIDADTATLAATALEEIAALRPALREALDGWERAETEAIRATASEAQAEIDIANSEDLARIAELRKLT